MKLNVLEPIEDVTARVAAAIPPGSKSEEAVLARRKAIAEIEQESSEATGLRSDVVTLFEGASYQLYRYKRYTDVRLVFAPEQGIAFFGGDPDNFEYPCFDLDICLFRYTKMIGGFILGSICGLILLGPLSMNWSL